MGFLMGRKEAEFLLKGVFNFVVYEIKDKNENFGLHLKIKYRCKRLLKKIFVSRFSEKIIPLP